MMKKISSILVLLAVLSGCSINDSYKNCVKRTELSLRFEYYADGDANVLPKYIETAKVYVYDSENFLVDSIQVDQEGLAKETALGRYPAGAYTLVSWANMHHYSTTSNTKEKELARLDLYEPEGRTNYTTSDQLYYAKKVIEIPENPDYDLVHQVETLVYRSAHIKFKVVVKGGKGEDVQVRFNHMLPQYDFDMKASKPYIGTYCPQVSDEVFSNNGYQRIMDFSTFRIKTDNLTTIDLLNAKGEKLLPSIQLKDYLREENIVVEEKEELTLYIEFQFTELHILVTIKEWESVDIIPEN